MSSRIAVIGAGPKGAAIAATAASMSNAGLANVPEVTIFDFDGPGAAWTGDHGYTDGEQSLCTLAERDLGFPYDRFDLGGAAAMMLANVSWQAFCVSQGEADTRYDRWVLKGRRPPAHADFAKYLKFAILSTGAKVVPAKVTKIERNATSEWKLYFTRDDELPIEHDTFKGVVITGSGAPIGRGAAAFAGATMCPCLFNSCDFWSRTHEVKDLLQQTTDQQVVIVGAGGAGAAVASWFVRNRYECPITIVGREPTLYTRQSGFFEERLFTDLDAWNALPEYSKDAFLRHMTAGVVWESVLREITRDNISYKCCDAVGIVPSKSMAAGMPTSYCLDYRDAPDQLRDTIDAEMRKAGCTPPARPPLPVTRMDATVIVDARGFDRLSFVSEMGLDPTLAQQFQPHGERWVGEHIDDTLALSLPNFPSGLHLPALGSRRGPGATNLMALGWLANRILSAY